MASSVLVADEIEQKQEQEQHIANAQWVPAVNPWLIAIAVIIPTFMEVLDTTIANVALNNIAGGMSVSYSQATWVLTSYLISNAVVLPLTAWLGNRFQRKRFLLFCILLFTASSLMCGLSVNLPMLLVMRVLQGIGGGALAPISQAILMESFPPRKQGIAQALFGLGVVVAPVVGPVLGGWLTDSFSWRWIFYINVPIGLIAFWAIQQTVEDPPWVRNSDPGPLDVFGLVALSLWLGCQEVVLDKGQEDDWFGSSLIRIMFALAVGGFVVFVARELKAKRPMVDLHIFTNRNYATGTGLIFFTCVLLYGIGLLTPEFLQLLMGYTSFSAGVATCPFGLGAMVSMILVGIFVARIDPRAITVLGFLTFGLAGFMLSRINLSIEPVVRLLAADSLRSADRIPLCPGQRHGHRALAPRPDRFGHRLYEPHAQCRWQRGHRRRQYLPCPPRANPSNLPGGAHQSHQPHPPANRPGLAAVLPSPTRQLRFRGGAGHGNALPPRAAAGHPARHHRPIFRLGNRRSPLHRLCAALP